MQKKIRETALLLFIFLLPLKFTKTLDVPGTPASYWGDFFSLIYTGWSPHIFALVSGILLCWHALAAGFRRSRASVQLLLWLALAAAVLAGCVQASCREYVRQTVDVLFGLVCFAGTLHLALEDDESGTLAERICTAVAGGAVITVLSGWDQLLTGLEAVRAYVAEHQLEETLSFEVNRQLLSSRIFGTFQLCNTYAGYLAAMLPFLLYPVWRRIPQKWKMPAVCLTALSVCVPLVMTGSRGALLSLGAGLFFTSFFLVRQKRYRVILSAGAVCAGLAMLLLVLFWRGAESVIFRLDYDWAALRMMLAHPFTGTGWGDFLHEYPGLKILHNDEAPHSPHNLILFFGSQCGTAGFLLAAAISFYPLYRGFRSLKRNGGGNLFLAALTASLLILTVDAQLEVGIESPAYACTLILFSMLILHRTKEGDRTVLFQKQLPPFRHIVLFLLSGLTVWIAWIEIRREYAFAALYEAVYPQFSRTPEQSVPPEQIRKLYNAAPQDSPFVHLTMASRLEAEGNYHTAQRLLFRAIRLSPADAGIRRWHLRLLRLTGAPASVIQEETECILLLDPNNPENQTL